MLSEPCTVQHKRVLVDAFKVNFITGFVGDNTNDMDAIWRAHTGFYVGNKSDFARQAAKVNAGGGWNAIVRSIATARSANDSIGLSGLMVADNIGIVVAYLIGMVKFGAKFTILPDQIALMNLLVDGLPTYMTPYNPVSDYIMTLPPPKKGAPLVHEQDQPRYNINAMLIVVCANYCFSAAMNDEACAAIKNGPETCFGAFLIANKLAHLVSNVSRTETVLEVAPWRNPRLVLFAAANFAFYLVAMYVAPFDKFFGLAPLTQNNWNVIGTMVAGTFVADQLLKVILRSTLFPYPRLAIAILVAVCACAFAEFSGV